jgi:hypothetical protein
MGSYNRWNSIGDRFCVGGAGVRHLPEIILRRLFTKKFKLAVLVFHEDVKLAINIAKLLKDLGFEIKPLREAVKTL